MAYLDTPQARSQPGAVAAVIAIHAGIGYLVITGLSAVIFEKDEPEWKPIIDFPVAPAPDTPKPPERRPEQTETTYTPPSKITLPRLEVEFPPPLDFPELGDLDLGLEKFPVGDPTPPVSFEPAPPRPRNDPARWVTTADYPSSPLRRGQEGLTRFRLEIAANGRIENCTITASSGVPQLDKATCRYVSKRASFHPARDTADQPVAGRYDSSVSWVIPD